MPGIEQKAARRIESLGLADIVGGEPSNIEFIDAVARCGSVFVAAHADGPVGFALAGFLDRAVHLYELAVLEEHGRRGLGRALVERVGQFASTEGRSSITLSTFREIAWNGPFYERLGFRYLARQEWTPALHILRLREVAEGLPIESRGFMRKDL